MPAENGYKVVGSACGQRGQYTFYKALRVSGRGGRADRILAIGDFFLVRLWQDSELISVGELQLVWLDRISDCTLVSIRLYFMPENTPEGRSGHGEDEVLAIHEKVVVKAEDLQSWLCDGSEWRWGMKAIWRGDSEDSTEDVKQSNVPSTTSDLYASRLDFAEIDKEKSALLSECPPNGSVSEVQVVVMSYPRYCRYRALARRLCGLPDAARADWLARSHALAALGGYASPAPNTRILYCRDTFEYPELEGHEFVCNHLAPRLKGRPRGRGRPLGSTLTALATAKRNRDRSRSDEKDKDESSASETGSEKAERDSRQQRSPSLIPSKSEDRSFVHKLRTYHRQNSTGVTTADIERIQSIGGSKASIRMLYEAIRKQGGYEAVCRAKAFRKTCAEYGFNGLTTKHYDRLMLPFERHLNGGKTRPTSATPAPKAERRKNSSRNDSTSITIDITDSPVRGIDKRTRGLRTPSPRDKKGHSADESEGEPPLNAYDPSNILNLKFEESKTQVDDKDDILRIEYKEAAVLNQEFLDSLPKPEKDDEPKPVKTKISVKPPEKLLDPKADPSKKNHLAKDQGEQADPKPAMALLSETLAKMADVESLAKHLKTKDGVILTPELAVSTIQGLLQKQGLNDFNITSVYNQLAASKGAALGNAQAHAYNFGQNHLNNGSTNINGDKPNQSKTSSLRSIRVKPSRQEKRSGTSAPTTPPHTTSLAQNLAQACSTPLSRRSSMEVLDNRLQGSLLQSLTVSSRSDQEDDEEVVEVPYTPKSPEIIDLDLYEPNNSEPKSGNDIDSASSVNKGGRLNALRRAGLQVTTVVPTSTGTVATEPPNHQQQQLNISLGLNPALQHQILNQAQFFQVYGGIYKQGTPPPRVTQGKSIYCTTPGPEKTVYGNPKDPFMPPPHYIHGTTPRHPTANRVQKSAAPQPKSAADILDLTCKPSAVEIVKVPVPKKNGPPQPQNLSAEGFRPPNNLEITLVGPAKADKADRADRASRPPQKRSASGKFASNKAKEEGSPHCKAAKPGLVVPSYRAPSPPPAPLAALAHSLRQTAGGAILAERSAEPGGRSADAHSFLPLLDPSLYVSALYGGLGSLGGLGGLGGLSALGGLGALSALGGPGALSALSAEHARRPQLAMLYKQMMLGQAAAATPTTKN